MIDTTTRPKPPGNKPVPIQPPEGYHPGRKRIHFVCFLIFLILPFFDIMRFDIPKQRFYFAGQELWISEFGIIFLTIMFMLFCVVAISMMYGRMYCAYACPQMIFSEASLQLQDWIDRRIRKKFIGWPSGRRALVSGTVFYSMVGVASVFLGFVFICYFVEPRDLIRRLFSFDLVTAGGIAGAATTLLTFLDFAFLRQRFCTTICPYGYLQGMLGDKNTLLVHYRDEKHECIECKKCVRICHMGIDIRKSPFQIECIHCGECIDACDQVLARLGKPGLIHFAWGEQGEAVNSKTGPWYLRLGIRDAKRAIVLGVIVCYATGLGVALSLRKPVLVRIAADRSTLYSTGANGETINKFRVIVANRGKRDATVTLHLEGLDQGRLAGESSITLHPGVSEQHLLEVSIPRAAAPSEYVTHFRFAAVTEPGRVTESFDTTFIRPPGKP